MSETRMQDEYNKEIRACDIFVSLFFTKTGKFTEEEFDVVHRQFKERQAIDLYLFQRHTDHDRQRAQGGGYEFSMVFSEKAEQSRALLHPYDNIEHLKRQFRDQLDKLLEQHD